MAKGNPIRIEQGFVSEVHQGSAEHGLPRRASLDRLHAIPRDLPVEANEVSQLLDPLPLNVLSWRDHHDSSGRVQVAKQRHDAQRDIGLPHTDFVGQVRAVIPGQHVA